MVAQWTNWKPFPNGRSEPIDAPAGPGIYEVCNTVTGEQVAFGHAPNVARALADVAWGGVRGWALLRRLRARPSVHELEFRTCAVATPYDARVAADQMVAHRNAVLRRMAAPRR